MRDSVVKSCENSVGRELVVWRVLGPENARCVDLVVRGLFLRGSFVRERRVRRLSRDSLGCGDLEVFSMLTKTDVIAPIRLS